MGYFYAKQFRQTPFQKNSPKMQKIVKKYKNFPDCCPWERKGIPSALITKKPQKKGQKPAPIIPYKLTTVKSNLLRALLPGEWWYPLISGTDRIQSVRLGQGQSRQTHPGRGYVRRAKCAQRKRARQRPHGQR